MSTIIAPRAAVPSRSPQASPVTGIWRLAWKEYRTIRLFWLMLAGLSVVVQWLTASLWHNEPTAIALVYNFALGAPVLFAVACAAAAFAIEREEGTIEFLRAAPVSAGQVFVSKVAIAFIGTIAMFAILLPLARLFAQGQLPSDAQWRGMLGLWLVSAVEAIAWGTLFSLLGARPLVAVVLTLVAVSTCDHALARLNKGPTPEVFEWLAYLRAAPWHGGIALVVLAADVYLGLRWLDGSLARPKKRRMAPADLKAGRDAATARSATDSAAQLKPLLAKRDRSTMLGHLLWQQWRQSRSLMSIMMFLSVAVPIVGIKLLAFMGHGVPILSIAAFSTLMGAMVFLPDQEQRRYRFFAEHNVPSRLVWLSRQLPWMAILVLSIAVVSTVWLFTFVNVKELLRAIGIITDPVGDNHALAYYPALPLPPFALGIAIGATGYAIGQFFSLLIRSGVLAAAVALGMGVLLWTWAYLMSAIGINLLWSVAPIPIALVLATLLRASDWVAENKRWIARGRLAATLVIPAAALLVAVPFVRMNQIPQDSPGFDVAEYEGQIQNDLAAGMSTADLYRKASDLLSSPPEGFENRQLSASLDDRDRKWLAENQPALRVLLAASARKKCIFSDPRAPVQWTSMYKQVPLIQIVVLSARELELNGDLDAALDRDFAALRVVSHLSSRNEFFEPALDCHDVFYGITCWGARTGQSKEKLASAIKRLSSIDSSILRLDERLKSDYLVALRAAAGDASAIYAIGASPNFASELLRRGLLPWERDRATRLLNILTQTGLQRLREMRSAKDRPPERKLAGAFINFCLPAIYRGTPPEFFETTQVGYPHPYLRGRDEKWLETTVPNLWHVGVNGVNAANRLAWFEADRRATIIILAIEEYRLDHSELPRSLDQLKSEYLNNVPLDPYSGCPFVYFPKGIAVPPLAVDSYFTEMGSYTNYSKDWWRSQYRSPPVVPGVPGIWSTGAGVRVSTYPRTEVDADLIEKGGKGDLVSQHYRREGFELYTHFEPIWLIGDWFGIPDKQ
jgi:ABC-2 family transporter protein